MPAEWEKPGIYRVPCRIGGGVSIIEVMALNTEDAKRRLRAHGYEVLDSF